MSLIAANTTFYKHVVYDNIGYTYMKLMCKGLLLLGIMLRIFYG